MNLQTDIPQYTQRKSSHPLERTLFLEGSNNFKRIQYTKMDSSLLADIFCSFSFTVCCKFVLPTATQLGFIKPGKTGGIGTQELPQAQAVRSKETWQSHITFFQSHGIGSLISHLIVEVESPHPTATAARWILVLYERHRNIAGWLQIVPFSSRFSNKNPAVSMTAYRRCLLFLGKTFHTAFSINHFVVGRQTQMHPRCHVSQIQSQW